MASKSSEMVMKRSSISRFVTFLSQHTIYLLSSQEVVVGDIALVEPGEIIPCDGIFISGHNVKCDESGATGESDAIRKHSYADVVELTRTGHAVHTDCFMISGSKVIEGVGKYVVVAVGTKSFNGRIMMGMFLRRTLIALELDNVFSQRCERTLRILHFKSNSIS